MDENNMNIRYAHPDQPHQASPTLNSKIIVDDAIKIYKRGKIEVVALRGLSCEFHSGEITVIMGPSGCGKTTLLNILAGLDVVTSGRIWINGIDITKLNNFEIERYRREKVGIVFQFLNLIPELNAYDNITLPLELAGTLTNEHRKKIDDWLQFVGLMDRKHHRPDELSGGEQQRIGIAAALANDPEIILCDEPTGELDSESKKIVMDLLRNIITQFPNKTIIIVTHDPELRTIADRMYYIRDGKISHKFSKQELNQLHTEGDGQVKYDAKSRSQEKEQALLELREVAHYVGEKIEKIEKKIHPI